jgi:hypothetical protein
LYACAGLSTASRDGAHWSAIPVVPWAKVTTGHPPFGALPFGTETVPDTATGFPSTPVERYRSSLSRVPPATAGDPVSRRCQIGVPCAAFVTLAGGV